MIIIDVIGHFGTRGKLAKALGVSRVAVSQFERQGYFPGVRAIQIEELTDGKFKAKDLIKKD